MKKFLKSLFPFFKTHDKTHDSPFKLLIFPQRKNVMVATTRNNDNKFSPINIFGYNNQDRHIFTAIIKICQSYIYHNNHTIVLISKKI